MRRLFIALTSLAFTACAMPELKNQATPGPDAKENLIAVTSDINSDVSDKYNVLLQINFHNKSGKWLRIDSAKLDLNDEKSSPYNIILGKDLITWAESKAEEKKMDRHNENAGALLTTVAGAGLAILGAASNNKGMVDIGNTAMVGGVAYQAVKGVTHAKDKAQGVDQVPETHLYAPFDVPSMSLTKRWILINFPNGKIPQVGKLELKTIEGETYTYFVRVGKLQKYGQTP